MSKEDISTEAGKPEDENPGKRASYRVIRQDLPAEKTRKDGFFLYLLPGSAFYGCITHDPETQDAELEKICNSVVPIITDLNTRHHVRDEFSYAIPFTLHVTCDSKEAGESIARSFMYNLDKSVVERIPPFRPENGKIYSTTWSFYRTSEVEIIFGGFLLY